MAPAGRQPATTTSRGGGGKRSRKHGKKKQEDDTHLLVEFRALVDSGNPRAVQVLQRFEQDNDFGSFKADAKRILAESPQTTPQQRPEISHPPQAPPQPAIAHPPPGLQPTARAEPQPGPQPGLPLHPPSVPPPPPSLPPPRIKTTTLPPPPPSLPPPGLMPTERTKTPPPPGLSAETPRPVLQPPPGMGPPVVVAQKREIDDAGRVAKEEEPVVETEPVEQMLEKLKVTTTKPKKERAPIRRHVGGGALTVTAGHSVVGVGRGSGVVAYKPKVKLDVEWIKEGGGCVIGLFRQGAPTNESAIVTKAPRVPRSSRGRIPFFAPRSAGVFVFRLLDEAATGGKFGPNTYATSAPFEVVVGGNELAESISQSLQQMQDQRVGKLGAVSHLTHVARHSKPDDVALAATRNPHLPRELSQCLELALDGVEAVLPGLRVLHARRRSGELPQLTAAEKEEEDKAKKGSGRKSPQETQVATHVLLDATMSGALWSIVVESTKRRVVARQALWCEMLEEYWDDAAALQRHYDRGLSYVRPSSSSSSPQQQQQQQLLSTNARVLLDLSFRRALSSLVPSQNFFELRLATRQRIETLLREALGLASLTLRVFGSSANLFGSEGADLDMFAQVTEETNCTRSVLVRRIGEAFEARPDQFEEVIIRDGARVPITMFKDIPSGLECDVSSHNPLALQNTALLRAYASIDQRVRAVAYVVKTWAKARGVKSPSDGTLSSYGYVLCVIHYLQTQTQPPLIPSLQLLPQWWPDKSNGTPETPRIIEQHPFEPEKSVDMYFHDPTPASLSALRRTAANNKQSIGDLVAGFFAYFAWNFDYRENVVSVRDPRRIVKKVEKAEHDLWPQHQRLAIEDPFEPWYDVAHVVKQSSKFALIRLEFMRAHDIVASFAADHSQGDETTAGQSREILADDLWARLCEPRKDDTGDETATPAVTEDLAATNTTP